MAKKAAKRCIVWNCTNRTSEGSFIGDLCLPCHQFITTLEGRHSQAYRNSLKVVVWDVGSWIERLATSTFDPTAQGQLSQERKRHIDQDGR